MQFLKSKTVIIILALIIIAAGVFSYLKYKNNNKPLIPTKTQTFSNDSSSSIDATDDLIDDNDADNIINQPTDDSSTVDNSTGTQPSNPDTAPVSPVPTVKGSKLANITPEHCNNDCQAFSIDLKLFEYCQQACGISPVKNVTSCDDQSGIQKDYCAKDLAINKNDASLCDKVNDANIKQACKSRIEQDVIENMQNNKVL